VFEHFFASISGRIVETSASLMNRIVLLASLLLTPLCAFAAGPVAKTLTPADNLVVEGIPPIPAEVPEQVGRYTESRAASFQDWHPTRPEMLVTTRFGDTNQLHHVIQPGGARTQLTFFPDRVDSGSFEPTKGDYFVFSKGAGGNEFNQNYRYDFSNGEITLLTDGKSRNSEPVWSNQGERIIYTSTRRNGADTDLYVESPTDPKSDRLLAELEGGGWEPTDWSPDDKQLLVVEGISINESYLWLFDTQTGVKKEITPRPPGGAEKVAYSAAVFSKDGKGVFVTTDRESEFQRLAYIDLANGKHTYLLPNVKWDMNSWDLSHDGKQIAYALNENGVSTLHVIELVSGNGTMTARPQNDPTFDPPLPAVVITGLRWHPDPKQGLLAFNVAGARSPSDVYTWSVAGGKTTTARWTTSETGGIPATQFVEPELIRWKSFDGKEITGFLYAPDATKFPGPPTGHYQYPRGS
jgi:dipeptidyl aminopeptidase/acylaminoacyl peptidase